jgi:hypothetical protein
VRPAAAATPRSKPARTAAGDRPPTLLGAWARTLAGVVLFAAVMQWPYASACGLPLMGYLSAVGMVLVAGAWAGLVTWQTRTGAAHVVALAVLLGGTLLLAAQVLPRLDAAQPGVTWYCSR